MMKKIFFVPLFVAVFFQATGQRITYQNGSLSQNEPSKEKMDSVLIFDTVTLKLKSKIENDSVHIAVGKESKVGVFQILTLNEKAYSANGNLVFKGNSAKVTVRFRTNLSDEDEMVILKITDSTGEQIQQDTLKILNTYPFTARMPEKYTDWNNPKRAEIFIGSNFDMISKKFTLTDWYGGIRVFLPNIMSFRKQEKTERLRWGFAGGIYQNRSLTNFGNEKQDTSRYTGAYCTYISTYNDTIKGRQVKYRNDTLKVAKRYEINNFGLYFTPLFEVGKYTDQNISTHLYAGIQAEVIRRNYSERYTIDTVSKGKYEVNDSATFFKKTLFLLTFPPSNRDVTLYDGYFSVVFPVQFLWKDILECKVVPGIGINPKTNSLQGWRDNELFYLFQFDLLAKLGGISLNIGGEVRGFFPNEEPIITAYLGTSFTIAKLKDFLVNK